MCALVTGVHTCALPISTLVSWNYYCVDPNVDAEGRALADRFFNYLRASPLVKERTHAVKLGPGDAVTWKDRRVLHRSEERRVGKEWGSTCRSRGAPVH